MTGKRGRCGNIGMSGIGLWLLLTLTTGTSFGQRTENWVGTWELNLEESTFRNSEETEPPWKGRTWTITAVAGGLTITDNLVPTKGTPIHQEYTVTADGGEVPIERLPDFTISFRRVNDSTFELVTKTESSSSTERFVVSPDGNSLTHTFVGIPTNTDVYDKQP